MAKPAVKLCPNCDGTGTPNGKRRFLNGAIIDGVPTGERPPECEACKGDGYIYVSHKQHP
jgi:DnaJ-class molecular chaperone